VNDNTCSSEKITMTTKSHRILIKSGVKAGGKEVLVGG